MNGPGVRDRRPPPPAPATARIARPASQARAHAIDDGVWALRLPLCYAAVTSVNAYLLRLEHGWLMVDCGSAIEPGWEALTLALAAAGVTLDDLEALVVTHAHSDHRGLAAELVDRTGCRFAMGPGPHPRIDVLRDPAFPLSARRARGLQEGIPAAMLDALVDQFPADDWHFRVSEPDRVLEPGEELLTESGVWEVHAAPGHSADQLMLWNADRRWLMCADLALPGIAAYLEYGTRPDPHGDQVDSLTRAIALEPELLLGGHGRPIARAVPVLLRCRELVVARLERVSAALGSTPLSGWDLVELVRAPTSTIDELQRMLAETLCVLEHLETQDRARAVIDDDGRRCWLAGRAAATRRH